MAPLVRTGGSRHTGLAALPHRNIHNGKITAMISSYLEDDALPTTEIEELRSILTKMSQKGGK